MQTAVSAATNISKGIPVTTNSNRGQLTVRHGDLYTGCVEVSEEGGQSRVEAGSNASTVTLRVVGGDKKGSLESETVKYGHESHGTRTRK
jgi:hypothetical protein